jgi:phage terminase large subunit-like protein
MPSRGDTLELLDIEIAIKEAEEREALGPVFDWYGPDCGCPAEGRKPNGACPLHKRAREKQRPPDRPWKIWYIEAGRGFGKTETGAQWIIQKAKERGKRGRFALVAPTAADIRDVMIEGESGIKTISPPWFNPQYEPTKRRLTWPNGAVAHCYSAEEPDRLRGPQHTHAWLDEPATWKCPETFDMLMFGLRIGDDPQAVMTTTPKPHRWLREIKKKATTALTRGTSYENKNNLAPSYYSEIIAPYEGTKQGRREIEAIDEDDAEGALWTSDGLDARRIAIADMPTLDRVIVAVDPSVADPGGPEAAKAERRKSDDRDMAECGIVLVGVAMQEHPTLGWCAYAYVLLDASLARAHPNVWGQRVIEVYQFNQADVVVAEVNNGGAMVESVLRAIDQNVSYKKLTATRGKRTRAEPVAALYQQGRVFHVRGVDFGQLEAQMTTWVPGMPSPDRLDALVWGVTEAVLEGGGVGYLIENPIAGYRGLDS